MAPVSNTRIIFKEIPKDFPIPGTTTTTDTTQKIDPDTVPLNGGFLLKTLVLSVDPYQRGRMRDPSVKSYAPPFIIGEPIDNFGVGVVLRSENPDVQVGDHLDGFLTFAEYQVKSNVAGLRKTEVKETLPSGFRKLENKENLPWSAYVGPLGITGKTAYYGWSEFSLAKKGEVVFVSGGAGGVGSFVVQLAKLQGLKVIASAGTDAKVNYIKSLGADVAFNYKTSSTPEVLAKEGPLDIYWDNVGGETLEAALDAAAVDARFIMCGTISSYNTANGPGIRNISHVFAKSIKMSGFLTGRLTSKHEDDFYATVPGKIARGEIKYVEHRYEGLEKAEQALRDVQTGANEGKCVVIVAGE